MNKVREVSNL